MQTYIANATFHTHCKHLCVERDGWSPSVSDGVDPPTFYTLDRTSGQSN